MTLQKSNEMGLFKSVKLCYEICFFILCLSSIEGLFAQSVPSYVTTNGLVGWWGFNGNAQDGSGNGNHGSVNHTVYSNNRFGQSNSAIELLSKESYIDIPDVNSTDITISMFYYFGGIPGNGDGWNTLVGRNGGSYHHILIGEYPNHNIGYYNGGFYSSGFQLIVGQWYHIVCAKTGSRHRLWIDNILIQDTYTSFTNSTYPVSVLGNTDIFAMHRQGAIGKLDDIGIWNRALTQQEITNLYTVDCNTPVNVITSQPQNQSTLPNRNVTFSVTSSDSSSTYQWESNSGFGFQPLFNAGQYSGVNTSSLTVSNTSLQNNNQLFRCLISTNACGRDTSDVATLSVNSSASTTNIPKRFNYQSVVRDTSGGLVTNRTIGLKMTLSRGPHLGDLYSETHQLTSNSNGLITSSIGGGTPVLGSMDSIDWSLGDVYIKTEVDVNGGTNYVVLNTNQLLSVPYSLYSLNSGNSVPGPVGPQGPQGGPGNAGVGILNITSNSNQLLVTLTNGSVYSVPIPNNATQQLDQVRTLIYTTDGF